jgi:hypothetical protein
MNGTRTSKQLADLEVKCTTLCNQIHQWRKAQLVNMPCIGSLMQTLPTAAKSPSMGLAEFIPLYLPSSLPQHLRLRVAQANDALADIQRQCQIFSGLWHWQFKRVNIDGTGNRACTRMQALYNRFSLRTQRCAGHYCAVHDALVALDPSGSWQSCLQVLKDANIRGLGKDDDGVGNSQFEPSWIWLVPGIHSAPDTGTLEQTLDESLQVEWSKSQAQKQCWEEEVIIIQEEMCRVIKYHEWRAQWW